MNRTELIAATAARTDLGVAKAAVGEIVDSFLDQMRICLNGGDVVDIKGFGRLFTKQTAQKRGRNPRTGEEITIPARLAVKFKPSPSLLS